MTTQDSFTFQSPLVRRRTPAEPRPGFGQDDGDENNVLPTWLSLRTNLQTPQSRRFITDPHGDGRSRFGGDLVSKTGTAVKTGFKARLEAKRQKEEDWVGPIEKTLSGRSFSSLKPGGQTASSIKPRVDDEGMLRRSRLGTDVSPPLDSLTDLLDAMQLGKDAAEESRTKSTASYSVLRWSPSIPSGRKTIARQPTQRAKDVFSDSVERRRRPRGWTRAHDVIISLRHDLPEVPVPAPVPVPAAIAIALRTTSCFGSTANVVTPNKSIKQPPPMTPPAETLQELQTLRRQTEEYLNQPNVVQEKEIPVVVGKPIDGPSVLHPVLQPIAPKKERVVEERIAQLKALRQQANQVFS